MPFLALPLLLLTVQAPPVDSRIRELESAPLSQRPALAAKFLEGLKTPLMEPDPASSQKTLTTFVWKGDEKTAIVGLVCDFGIDSSTQKLFRIEGTDIWYRTYSLPSDCRFYYRIAASDSLPPIEKEATWLYQEQVQHGDPFNPVGITYNRTRRYCYAILPKAPKLPIYEDKGAPKGKFEPGRTSSFQIPSTKLGNHKVWLYTTPGFQAGKPSTLFVFLDGSGRFQAIESITMLDNLYADKKIGQTVAIYTDSPDRERDLSCSDEYLKFLTDELIPWVKERYKTRFEAKKTVINGASLGGLFSGYAALKRPDVFGNALMQSPSIWWHPKGEESDWLIRQFMAAKQIRGRYYLAPGVFEKTAADPQATGILFSSRWLADVLNLKRVPMKYAPVSGGHDPLCWQTSLPDGILWLLGNG